MTKEQEAQQAQTIANVRNLVARDLAWAKQANGYCGEISSQPYLERLPALLEIVDSQAQKIEQQDADIANLLNKLANWPATYERQEQKIAEQAKEIERLKQNVKDIDPEREP